MSDKDETYITPSHKERDFENMPKLHFIILRLQPLHAFVEPFFQ